MFYSHPGPRGATCVPVCVLSGLWSGRPSELRTCDALLLGVGLRATRLGPVAPEGRLSHRGRGRLTSSVFVSFVL